MSDPRFKTIDEIAKEWKVSKMTVYRLYHAGKLRGARVGRSIRIYSASVEDYLTEARDG